MFETDHLIVHQLSLRADDIIDISYTQKRFMFDWGCKTETWSFDRKTIPDVELEQLLESVDTLITLAEIKGQGGND